METTGYTYRIEDGFVHVYIKPDPPCLLAIQEALDCLTEIKRECKTLFVLLDPKDAIMLNADQRTLVMSGFNEIVLGMAVLNNNVFVKMKMWLIMKYNPPSFPLKVFKDEVLAKKWLSSLKDMSLN